MIVRLISTAVAIAALSVASVAWADAASVNLSSVNGEVMVNQGQGFKPATAGMNLRAGDRVLVTTHGRAGLVYPGGCSVALTAGSMATISSASPCKTGRHRAGIISSSQDDGAVPVEGPSSGTPFGLSPAALSLLVVGGFTLGAAGLSGAFESNSP